MSDAPTSIDLVRSALAGYGIHPSEEELAVLAGDLEFIRAGVHELYAIPGVETELPAIGFTPDLRLDEW